MAAGRTIDDVVCLGCSCLCDDIRVTLNEGGVADAQRACQLGREWFASRTAPAGPECEVDGRPSSLEEGCRRAAQILQAARAPLVCGLAGVSTDAQRIAVAIADRLGVCVDWTTSAADAAPVIAYQTHGSVTASLGEVAQRADLVILWRCDPATTHPRHFERYSLEPTSRYLPRGRADRTVVAVGDANSATAALSDVVLPLKPHADYAALAILHVLIGGIDPGAREDDATGVATQQWTALGERIRESRYTAIIYGRQLVEEGHAALGALTRLAQAAQDHTRLVTAPLGASGNGVGAESVLTWQTGYPMAVSFARGYPAYGPDEYATHALLERGEADAALVVAEDGLAGLCDAARERLRSIPTIVLTSRDVSQLEANVLMRVAPLGAAPGGDVYRADGVALPQRNRLVDGRTSAAVLAMIQECLVSHALTSAAPRP